MVYGFLFTVAGRRRHMNVSKTSSKKLDIRKHVFLHPRLRDTENTNGVAERGDKAVAS
jgi:hypothetical protein